MRKSVKFFYDSKEWKQIRKAVILRAHGICEICGQVPGTEVHHLIHVNDQNVYDPNVTLNMDNLRLVCRECHFQQHRGEHGRGRITEENYPYAFDENGQLIQKPRSDR